MHRVSRSVTEDWSAFFMSFYIGFAFFLFGISYEDSFTYTLVRRAICFKHKHLQGNMSCTVLREPDSKT